MAKPLKTILYLEDDPAIAEIVKIALTEFSNFEVEHHDNGASAIEAYRRRGADLLLFDMMLPEMDGLETFRRIESLAPGSRPPVIFMTAKVQRHECAGYTDAGAIGVVPKPFDPITLGETIGDCWREHSSAQPAP